jgi:hypothetical protein
MRPIPLLKISVAAALAASAPASAVTISPTRVRFPQMAVGTHGRTVVAWERLTNGRFSVEARIGDGPLRLGRTSATGIAGEAAPIAVSGPAGAAVAFTVSGNVAGLVLVRRAADGSCAAPQTIAVTDNVTNVFAQGLHATLPAGGAAIAA